jgi:RNA polymerase sigma factor (sigma-70 family)
MQSISAGEMMMDDAKDYRVTIRVRNNNLLRLIEEGGVGPIETAGLIGITYSSLNDYLNMTVSPLLQKTGELKQNAQLICDYFCVMPYEVWSDNQLVALESNKRDVEFSYQELARLERSSDPLKEIGNSEFIDALDGALGKLTKREQVVINHSFGIDGEKMTLDAIGAKFDISRERVRQIREKALRKLRHPDSGMKDIYGMLLNG